MSLRQRGDIAAAKALIPYFDQALGRPQERVQHTTPTKLEDLEAMPTEELERLVAQGRARRLGLAPEPAPDDSPAGVDVGDDLVDSDDVAEVDDLVDVSTLLPRIP
jgi:hypothetical protein